ncbi:MmgE/PrpD family protein [Desulforhopalus singaporensis]|uniref:2-methylcitrate dehydratase PrpD n=1 Tax=Desulforhopalus singaporensis TaxID=91360 RepID=A0A1H0RW58_9BACT|nr:MmgE/PrpD family protein [Desulforhopalus singaporensis]SDP33637.1 2-methylcitrate dehydratase PrpD [Desulforhopalus singaporensis]
MQELETPTASYAERLAGYTAGLSLEEVPDNVVSHAKHLLLDLLGAALAGVDTPEAQAAAKGVATLFPGGGPCTLWGGAQTSSAPGAALYNGIVSHARELDDFGGADHSGAVVIPALMAVAEAYPVISGKRLLEGMIVGYEVCRRVLDSAGGYRPHNHGDGFHSTGTCGAFGGAAAVARALNLDVQQTAWAIGLAGTFTGGTWAFSGEAAMSKRYNVGRAAESGVTAACLAKNGFTGPRQVFEARWGGFWGTYARTAQKPEALLANLGTEYGLMRSGIKPYAACRDIHSTLDVILQIKDNHRLAAEDIATIKVRCIPEMMQMVGGTSSPRSRLQAQLSLPYSVGVLLATGRAFIEEFEAPYLTDPRVLKLAALVELVESPELPYDSEPYISVETVDGRIIEDHVDYAGGAPQNPLAPQTVIEKYRALAARTLDQTRVERLEKSILGIETCQDVRSITSCLRPGHR